MKRPQAGTTEKAEANRASPVVAGLLLALGVGVIAFTAAYLGLFHGAQVRASDFFFRAADRSPSLDALSESNDSHVVIVGIDDESLKRLGRIGVWPRSYYASATERLRDAGASVIAFDILFADATTDDNLFAGEIAAAGNVVLPAIQPATVGTNEPCFLWPVDNLRRVAASISHANVYPDSDGVVRRVPTGLMSSAGVIPALGVAVAALYEDTGATYQSNSERSEFSAGVPLDSTDVMIVNYTTVVGDRTVPTVSFVDLLEGIYRDEMFAGKAVLIGVTATGLQDRFWTPCGRTMGGVEIHAAVVETIVSRQPLRRVADWATALTSFGLALIAYALVTHLSTARALFALAGTLTLYVALSFAAFDRGLMLNMLHPPGTLVASFSLLSVYTSAAERVRRRRLAYTFGRFVSAPVARQMCEAIEAGAITLGGTERQVSVLFADIRDFTELADRIQPCELVRIINAYLSAAIQAVDAHGGMVNKFGGDSVMALWNAPTDCASHTVHAVQAGLEIQRRVAALPRSDPSLPPLGFGVGINTGRVVAGTFGAEERLEYSVLGDPVNVASRVTALTPGGEVWLTAEAASQLPAGSVLQDVGCHILKGKKSDVQVYRVLSLAAIGRVDEVERRSDYDSS